MLWVVRLSNVLKASDARIVHDYIEATIHCQDFIDDLCPVDLLSDIEMSVSRARAQFLGRLRSLMIAHVGQPNPRTFANERLGDGNTDAA